MIEMREELQDALDMAATIAPEELPRLLGDIEVVRATALARLSSPAPYVRQEAAPDSLLDVREAAGTLGMSASYLYRHSEQFPFTRRVGRSLKFSAAGIQNYLRGGKRFSR